MNQKESRDRDGRAKREDRKCMTIFKQLETETQMGRNTT